MANRAEIQNIIESNVYDNLNKEILASMVRTVFEAFKTHYFNLEEDQLANLQYDNSFTLAEVFNSLTRIDKARIGAFNFASSGQLTDIQGTIIQSASYRQISGVDIVLEVVFNPSVGSILDKKFWFTLETEQLGDQGVNVHNDLTAPVYRIDTPTSMTISMREVTDTGQDFHLNIFMI